jgi:hypothetical protein
MKKNKSTMGRTKDLRDDIPFSPRHFGSMEEFAAAIGWDLSTKQPSRSSIDAGCVMQEHDYQALMRKVVDTVIDLEGDLETIENHVDRILSQYIEVDK